MSVSKRALSALRSRRVGRSCLSKQFLHAQPALAAFCWVMIGNARTSEPFCGRREPLRSWSRWWFLGGAGALKPQRSATRNKARCVGRRRSDDPPTRRYTDTEAAKRPFSGSSRGARGATGRADQWAAGRGRISKLLAASNWARPYSVSVRRFRMPSACRIRPAWAGVGSRSRCRHPSSYPSCAMRQNASRRLDAGPAARRLVSFVLSRDAQ